MPIGDDKWGDGVFGDGGEPEPETPSTSIWTTSSAAAGIIWSDSATGTGNWNTVTIAQAIIWTDT